MGRNNQKTEVRNQGLQAIEEQGAASVSSTGVPVISYWGTQDPVSMKESYPDQNMYFTSFSEVMTKETVQELIDRIYNHNNVCLRFSTEGGEVAAQKMLTDYLLYKNLLEDHHVEIVFDNILCSAGFNMFLQIRDEICCTFDEDLFCYGMIHKVDVGLYTQTYLEDYTYKIEKLLKMNKKLEDQLIELGLSKKLLKKFRRGDEVRLFEQDLKTLKIWQYETI